MARRQLPAGLAVSRENAGLFLHSAAAAIQAFDHGVGANQFLELVAAFLAGKFKQRHGFPPRLFLSNPLPPVSGRKAGISFGYSQHF
jgi:hypothetical protein